jgi:hypothetical protein
MQPLPASLQPHVIARDTGAAVARKVRGPSRKAVERKQLRAMGIPAYASDLSMRRGRCFKCKGRYSVVRLTLDYRSRASLETFAHVECALCGHVMYRTSTPRLGEYQSVRLTLILPSEQRRWFARGRWHVEGEDAVTVADATWSDLIDAGAEWRKRNDQYNAARARAKARKAERDAEAVARLRVTLDHMDALAREREREEQEARDREAARS